MFSIYRSSAGSGKTFTLVKEYLNIALKYPDAFKKILAITFTNKSTQEMKSRILDQLQNMSKGQLDILSKELMNKNEWTENELQQKSKTTLKNILNNYDYFSVKTIDSFFQDVLNNFVRELGIDDTFDIETDLNYVIDSITDKLIEQSNDIAFNHEISEWLLQFAENKLISGKKWDFKKELSILAKQTFSEKFITKENQILNYISNYENDDDTKVLNNQISQNLNSPIKLLLDSLNQTIKHYESSLISLGKEAITKIEHENLEIIDFLYGKSGVAGFLYNLSIGTIKPIGARVRNALNDNSKWYNKNSQNKDKIEQLVQKDLQNILLEIEAIQQKFSLKYNDAISTKPLLYALGIVSYIINSIKNFRHENQKLLISDTLILLNKLLKQDDTSFIYEKVGNYYNYVFIDEFQDVSNLQWQNLYPLIENILSQGGKLMIVGDAKQSIYRWRGSNSNLLTSKVEKDLKIYDINNIYLNTNWRSNNEIIEFNNNFFEKASASLYNELKNEIDGNEDKSLKEELYDYLNEIYSSYSNCKQKCSKLENINQKSISIDILEKTDKDKINFKSIIDEDDFKEKKKIDEYKFIINKIEELQDLNIELKDIAILVRNNQEIINISQAIENHKLNSKSSKYNYNINSSISSCLSSNIAIKLIINILKSLLIDDEFINIETAYIYHHYILNKETQDIINIDKSEITKIFPQEFLINRDKLYNLQIYDILEFIIKTFNIKKDIHIDTFLELVMKNIRDEDSSITSLLKWWEIKGHKYSINNTENSNSINLMTIHQSKGLQFKAVIIPFCNWKLDHHPSNPTVIWSEQNINEYSPPIVPLYYYKSLKNTSYLKDYFIEKINIYFDNLNLLYVAFTRAEEFLHIGINSFKNNINNVGDLVNNIYLNNKL
ncbi:MAG: UvrD-helicase domain-containing protein [Bacteroidetes bacterium]|nr:UvrD-helicase domain-containing protein [Bacteroidota bacterium]